MANTDGPKEVKIAGISAAVMHLTPAAAKNIDQRPVAQFAQFK